MQQRHEQLIATGFLALGAHDLPSLKLRGVPKPQHFAAKAKRVIFFMAGGARGKHLAPVFKFTPSDKSGLPIADAFQGTRLGTGSRGVPNIENRTLADGNQRRQLDFTESRVHAKARARSPFNRNNSSR